jgi:diacylglycerol kinase (ATP)
MQIFSFIINPAAGFVSQNTKLEKHILSEAKKHPVKVEIHRTKYAGHARELALQLSREGKIPVAVGGDGTVNEVATSLFNSNGVMGIIPVGSGNGVARHLKISTNLKIALNQLFKGKSYYFDVGKVNSHVFVMLMGIGFDALVAEHMKIAKKRGLFAYAKLVLRLWPMFKGQKVSITENGKRSSHTVWMLNVANASQFGNNFYIAPQASMQDGLLDLSILKPFPLSYVFELAFKMRFRLLRTNKYTEQKPTKELFIEGSFEHINLDGESVSVHPNEPLHVYICKNALQIIR